jgi:signal transduction histidine kinase
MVSSADILRAKILVVDDQETEVQLIERMLRSAGYISVESTTDPNEVCELYRKNRYGLILLDLQMPGMDGFEVMERLRVIEATGYLPVIAITAEPGHKLRALEAGAKDFVGKPFDRAELRARVHNILEVRLLHLETIGLDRLKTEFFANISHELRTPLALILAPVLKRLAAGWTNEEEKQDLELIERNARLLLRQVDDLLDLSRFDAARMNVDYAEVDLAKTVRLVASNFEGLAGERGLGFAVDAPGSLSAQLDPPKIERVLLNLLSNAFKFTPANGTVRIAVRRTGDRAIVEVEDSGPGIPPDQREVVFERFRQLDSGPDRQFGGTGLGLAIVRQLVSLHAGTIRIEERSNGRGSLFRVELPLLAPAGAEVRRTAEEPGMDATRQGVKDLATPEPSRQPSRRAATAGAPVVLLVEDNPDMNAFIAGALMAEDYRVVCAFDGQEGLDKALEVRPDLILCDIMMPRMSGDRLVKEIRAHGELEDVPIVLLTARADDELRLRLLREGAQDYLHKPFDTRLILAKVSRLIADRRRRRETEEALHRLSGSLLQLHDRERKQIARELHENTAQCLAALQISLSMARMDSLSPEVEQILDEGDALLEQCCSELRTLSYGLHPPLLDNLGLSEAIEFHAQNFNKAGGIPVSLDIPSDMGRLPAEIELTLFRVLQEALIDLRCHSGAGKASVRLFRDAFHVGLEVIARGWPAQEQGAEIGMASIRERIRSLGGRFEIARESKGTTLLAILPFEASQQTPQNDPIPQRQLVPSRLGSTRL